MADYNVNFFRPMTDMTKANTKLISTLVIIWAVAVFGFQILLMVLNKPTPEKAFTSFNVAWNNSEATTDEKVALSKAVVAVLGKNIAVSKEHKIVLTRALGWSLYENHPGYARNKDMEKGELLTPLKLKKDGFDKLYREIIAFYLPLDKPAELHDVARSFSDEDRKVLPVIMEKYLVHNENAFTKGRIFGFPFHYWYTAQFLLILFVGLCYFYAVSIDKLHDKYNIVEKDD